MYVCARAFVCVCARARVQARVHLHRYMRENILFFFVLLFLPHLFHLDPLISVNLGALVHPHLCMGR